VNRRQTLHTPENPKSRRYTVPLKYAYERSRQSSGVDPVRNGAFSLAGSATFYSSARACRSSRENAAIKSIATYDRSSFLSVKTGIQL
jgi:hypothetical protein